MQLCQRSHSNWPFLTICLFLCRPLFLCLLLLRFFLSGFFSSSCRLPAFCLGRPIRGHCPVRGCTNDCDNPFAVLDVQINSAAAIADRLAQFIQNLLE